MPKHGNPALLSRHLIVLLAAGLVAGCSSAQGEAKAATGEAVTSTSTVEGSTAAPGRDGLGIEVGRVSTPPTRVGPASGHPLETIDRDAGVSAQLSDGSVVWFFGDTAAYYPNATLRYFEIGTAAWAPADARTTTSDYSRQSRPAPFAEPGPDFPKCTPPADTPGMWPLAAAVAQVDGRDRVLVWMGNICLGSNRAAVNAGISLAEWWYDPAAPPDGAPVTATILNQNLFPLGTPRFGDAVLPDGDGGVFAYGCDLPADPLDPASGPCRVAQVSMDEAADAGAYRIWNGETWAANNEPADLDFAGATDGVGVPNGSFSVTRAPGSDAVVMGYSPWPSYVGVIDLRVAANPQGPFGPPAQVALPDCDDTLAGQRRSCYAANLQPFLTDSEALGLGWYDQMVEPGSPRGAFVVSRVPLTVTREHASG